ncbi:MAG: Ppx/GppA family phosphatase [Rhodobacteraceae bacterium]|nr:Ppx/GppA family phosphatase [Paracoccaceae bacterium]
MAMSSATETVEDWGHFGHPLFNDPAMKYLERVGVVDVGSNSVRLVIFDGAARSPAYFYNEKLMAALGAGVQQTGRLNPEGRRRALVAIRRFQLLAASMSMAPLTAVATAAVREAEDGPEFCDEVKRETGLTLHVIPGEEEARLSAQGVLLGWPDASGMVCDIGGSSMELAELNHGEVGACATSSLGPLRLQAIRSRKARKAHIRDTIAGLVAQMGPRQDRLYLVGGSWRAIARLDMERRGYPLHVLHEYRMTPKSVRETVKWIGEHPLDDLRAMTGISEARMALVPLACEVLKGLIRALKPREIAVSGYGIREGMLYEQMPDKLRRRDPLVEACRFAEAKDARRPGFGRVLYKFLSPLFRQVPPNRARVIKAACLLHDVSWRAHPDYRHEVCFDNATRASLGGLTHTARIFLGLALLHRYKNSREETRFSPLFELLTDSDLRQAQVLGRAMRFASMLAADDLEAMGELRWFPKKKVLELWLPARSMGLFGEVAEARFKALAGSLEADPVVKRQRRVR